VTERFYTLEETFNGLQLIPDAVGYDDISCLASIGCKIGQNILIESGTTMEKMAQAKSQCLYVVNIDASMEIGAQSLKENG
jgi:hypothetical protein